MQDYYTEEEIKKSVTTNTHSPLRFDIVVLANE